MAKFEIPTKDRKLFIQPNRSDIFGNIFATWNLDFDVNLGKARVSRHTEILSTSGDDADLGLPVAFVRTAADATDRWWALCGAVLFKNTNTDPNGSAFTQDAITNTPTGLSLVSSDMVEFNGALIVSESTDLNRLSTSWDANWWVTTLAQAALTSGIAHPLHVTTKTNILLIGDGNLVHAVDKNSNVKNSRLVLPSEFEVIWIRSDYQGTWIGARNKLMREAKAFFWDESAENYNQGYGLKHDMTFAGIIKDGICYTVNGVGQLLKFTGSSFEEVAVFPIFNQDYKRWSDGVTVIRNIHRNGMAIIDGKIHINLSSEINGLTLADFMENFPSGIWTYDERQGLRHKYGISQSSSEVDYGAIRLALVGALVSTQESNGLALVGASIATNATTEITAISYIGEASTRNHRGHFVSSIFESSAFEDVFQDILLSFKRFRNSGDRIIIKYRNVKNPNYPIIFTGTWSDTNTFTASSVAKGSLANMAVGDEVMVIKGKGSGATAHISAISEAGGTYTVDLDETITGVSSTAQFIVSNFRKVATISTQSIERQSFDLDVVGTFLQLKIELRTVPAGTAGNADSPELEKLVVNSIPENVI